MFNAPEWRLVSTWTIVEVFFGRSNIMRTGPAGLCARTEPKLHGRGEYLLCQLSVQKRVSM